MPSFEITFHGLDPSDALATYARRHFAHVHELDARITRCRVAIERRNHRHRHGERTRVSLEIARPGGDLVVTHEGDEVDAYVAVGHAFDAMRRQLVELLERKRGRQRARAASAGR